MKSLNSYFLTFVFLLLIINNISAQIQSSPTISTELLNNYEKDIYSLALNRIFSINSPATNEIEIPIEYCDTIWDAMACVFNAFPIIERDTVFDIQCIHNQQFYPNDFTSDIIIESNYFLYFNAWTQGIISTGDLAIDTLLANYGFTIVDFWTYNNIVSVHFETSQYINTYALVAIIDAQPQILNSIAGTGYFGGPTRKITYSKDEDYQYLNFRIAWGDCPAGCTDYKDWHFRVTDNYIVEYTGFSQTPPYNTYYPNYQYCNISNPPLFSYNEFTFCDGDSLFLNNQWYYNSATFNDTLLSSLGIDSIIFNSILELNSIQISLNETICTGDGYIIYGDTLYSTGVYNYIIPSLNGCDSLITLDLATTPSYEIFETIEICSGETYNFFGQSLDSSGTYLYSAITTSGCDSLVWMDLSLLPLPIIEFETLFEDTIYQEAGLIDLNIASPQGGMYSGTGINQNILDPQLISTGSSWIYYSYTDSISGCSNIDSMQIYILEGNIITDLFNQSHIKIYPNPTNDVVHVMLDGSIHLPIIISFYNSIGEKITETMIYNKSTNINISDFPKGIYLVQISNTTDKNNLKKHTQKLIIR